MVRTTHHVGWLIAALVGWTAIQVTFARAADPGPHEPASIAVKSTPATAGTGRRPIRERIAASNLPLRAIPKPADAIPEQKRDRESEEPSPQAAGMALIDPEPSPPEVAPAAAEPPAADQADFAEVAETTEIADHTAAPEVAEATETPPEVVHPEPAVPAPPEAAPENPVAATKPVAVETGVVAPPTLVFPPTPIAAEPDLEPVARTTDGAVDAQPLAAPPSAPPAPVALHPQPRRVDPVREALLNRVKDALAKRLPANVGGSPLRARTAAPPAAETFGAGRAIAAAPVPQPLVPPARLEFDVRESRSLVGEGEQIVMRIAVRNVGSATADRVITTLYFADGIEPVQAIGHAAEVYPGEVRFATVPELAPGSSVDLLVTAVGTRPGSVAYRGELACGQLAGPIAREGAVTVQPRRAPAP